MAEELEGIVYYRGNTHSIKLELRDRDTLEPIPLNDKDLTLTISSDENPTDQTGQQLQLTGSVFGDPADGVALFPVAAGESDFAAGTYWYDVEVKDTGTGDNKQTITKDKFHMLQGITQ